VIGERERGEGGGIKDLGIERTSRSVEFGDRDGRVLIWE